MSEPEVITGGCGTGNFVLLALLLFAAGVVGTFFLIGRLFDRRHAHRDEPDDSVDSN